ncbi:hypothetical protein ABXT08_12435 [Chryseobacterium sp. NRRL B-14859]|uniref:DUF6896 domain-containing protein n=1 Tax=Chryseobacterium sp. NRRL B-14859 TaxID=1562763 RepID=UPI00339161AF
MMDYLNNSISSKKILKEYLNFIADFEKEIKREKNIPKEENIWNYMIKNSDRTGIIKSYRYTVHGSGFKIEKDHIICEYDKAPLNEYEIKFSFWKFKIFVETNFNGFLINEHTLKKDLYNMVSEDILSWLIIDGVIWNIYQANLP